jgi:glycosyltransferase involved in cell wall biosynthesis
VPALQELAVSLGVADRLHVAPPVGQDQLVHYLSGADVAVHPMPGGSPNHDQALPNKLFEYLHAGLPLVVSDARLMAEFVTTHEVGQVFVAGDAVSYAGAVSAALAAGRRQGERVQELARQYSWQAQEPLIRDFYHRVTGFAGHEPTGAFPSLDSGASLAP